MWKAEDRDRRRPDIPRHSFVLRISEIFEQYTGIEPVASRDKSWCKFLAAILSMFEKKQLDPDGAYSLWLDTRKLFGFQLARKRS
jgi:hypothetical protein